MYIKDIQLEGFKSYQKAVGIAGFSKKFNAITGYNGSGKSNILDAICFVLGINKLDNIRAKSMAELITHGGTKATVQIRFDNTDKSGSPFGMENLDEIVVLRTILAQPTGKGCSTSYTLNGHAATNSKIHDFFRSIGLNVNNPHFLIMQGRITTVLNMKPEEILGMVEEAAGTKMYDQKKKDAEKTLFLKEAKVKEIDKIFEINIDPRMEKFREDRKNMVEVTRLGKVKEHAQQKMDAFNYHQTIENAKRDAELMVGVKVEVEDLTKKIEEIQEEVVKKENEKKELEVIRDDKDSDENLGEEYREKNKWKIHYETQKNAILEDVNKSKKEQKRLETNLNKDRKVISDKRTELANVRAQNEAEINQFKEDEALIAKYIDELEGLTRGTVANDQGQHVSIEAEIQECKTKSAGLGAAMTTAKARQDRLNVSIKAFNEEHIKLTRQNADEINDLTNLQKQVDDFLAEIAALNFDADADQADRNKASNLRRNITTLKAEAKSAIDRVGHRFTLQLAHTYAPPPVASFEAKNDIIGTVAQCVKLKMGCEQYATAVEIALGGLLGHVIVRSQDIARLLIDSKAFINRRTCIPISENARLAKTYSLLTDAQFQAACDIAAQHGEKVVKMIDLIEFPEYINHTFLGGIGNVLVVDTLDCARHIAYHKSVKTRVISMRGEDVKSSGVMTGGRDHNADQKSLLQLRPYHVKADQVLACEAELRELDAKLESMDGPSQKYQLLNQNLIIAQRKLTQIKNNMKNSELGVVQKDLDEATNELKEVMKEIEENTKVITELNKKVKNLEVLKNNDKSQQTKLKNELTTKLKKAQEKAESNREKGERAKRAVMQIAAAVDDLEQTIKNEEAELEKKKEEQKEFEEKLPDIEAALTVAVAESDAAKEAMDERKNKFRQVTVQLGKVQKEADMLRKEETKTKTKKEEREKEITRLYESEKANRKHAQTMLKKHEWINDEQVHFNKKGGHYDFEGYTENKGKAEIKEITDKIENLERRLCLKNVSNLDTCEAKVIEVKNKRERLNVDFDMLRRTIAVLDKRKVDELIRAHQSVNEDFGKIFNCLLPDANAQLVPPEGKTVCDGLEVKVSFNGVVKDSLAELSGGQRSLVALSLILAMLKFKPAPLYILDEVDAALDLSHTANIGMMIKSHFRNSQFIIVSLKQGMFSNADVLFQTSFSNGASICERLTGAALEKAKNDKELAKQADEITASEQAAKKKKPADPSQPSTSGSTASN